MTARVVILLAGGLAALPASAQMQTRLTPETNAAFESYVASAAPAAVAKAQQPRPLPWLGEAALSRARKEELVVQAMSGSDGHAVPNGIVHDWLAGTFIPGATIQEVTQVVQDFGRHKDWYPEIIESRQLARNSAAARGQWVLKKKKVITVVLRVDLESELHPVSPQHAYLISRTSPVIEVKDHGTSKQRDYPAGEGHGFLWRFNGYWNFHESDGGVWVECRVISLSRAVPPGLGWLVNPFIRSLPRESLESTLRHTREAVRGI